MKHIHIRAFAALLAIVFVFSNSPAHIARAEAVNPDSTASVEFEESQGPTQPVDPEDPTDPADPGEEGVVGSLAIVSVSDFAFGKAPISAVTIRVPIETTQPNVQIVDLRGTGKGWQLSAKLSNFYDKDDPAKAITLPGARILITAARPNSPSFGEISPYAPTQIPVALESGEADDVPVIVADEGEGMGLWVMRWYPDEVQNPDMTYVVLEVPVNAAQIGQHEAIIDWILTTAPTF